MTRDHLTDAATKVPAVTLGFWIKILATTLGETGGDTVSMSWLGETTSEARRSASIVISPASLSSPSGRDDIRASHDRSVDYAAT